MATPSTPEIIHSDAELPRGGVSKVEPRLEVIKTKAAVVIISCILIGGFATLALSLFYNKPELQTWATGIISAISGAAIGYGFNGVKGT